MGIRPKLFLISLCLGFVPMLLLSVLLYWNGTRSVEMLLRADVERNTNGVARGIEETLRARERGLESLARSSVLRDYLRANATAQSVAEVPKDVQAGISLFLSNNPKNYVSLTCLNTARQPLLRAEPSVRETGETEIKFQTEGFLSSAVSTDERLWTTPDQTPVRSSVVKESSGANMRYEIPVFTGEEGTPQPRGALIAELNGDEVFGEAVADRAYEAQAGTRSPNPPSAQRSVILLDRTGRILYHSNVTLAHQSVDAAIPSGDISKAMMSGESGWKYYDVGGTRWLLAYRPLGKLGMSVAVAQNYTAAISSVHRMGLLAVILSAVLGLIGAALITYVARGTARSIERVTEGAVAIAGGRLDQRIEVRSSDETRLLAESFNIMTDRLREQIARETESRQFESFMRLSAMLTHDLKNAIAALSLLVDNMKKQFHREEFREDAMKSLTDATDKLRGLVSKLSEPVQSLSSEHKLPRPTDLVPVIRRVVKATVDSVREQHEVEVDLPDTLLATVEADRIEKVFENLVINAVEAMEMKQGKLTIKAGPTQHGEVFFSVSDTGPGMSEEFKRTKLFRAFSTTKKRGVGLGLYTCREIVRAHNGHIDVESKRGSGATFRVVLPSQQKIMGRSSGAR